MDRLYFFSRSRDVAPGRGANEYVRSANEYQELSQIPQWRQMLSNFWAAPFEINGVRWNSVEHVFQASKLNLVSPAVAWQFTLNSGSVLSQGGGEDAQRQRKAVVLTPQQLAQWDQLRETVLHSALTAKFRQNSDLGRLLLLTRKAELWHGAGRTAPSRQYSLESVRDQLAFQVITGLLQTGRV